MDAFESIGRTTAQPGVEATQFRPGGAMSPGVLRQAELRRDAERMRKALAERRRADELRTS